jgi:hypothetical protein
MISADGDKVSALTWLAGLSRQEGLAHAPTTRRRPAHRLGLAAALAEILAAGGVATGVRGFGHPRARAGRTKSLDTARHKKHGPLSLADDGILMAGSGLERTEAKWFCPNLAQTPNQENKKPLKSITILGA